MERSAGEQDDGPGSERDVLVLTPSGRDAEVAGTYLKRVGVEVRICRQAKTLLDGVRDGCGPLLIAEEALDQMLRTSLGRLLKRQPAWSNLPLLILISRTGLGQEVADFALAHQATLLQRPLQPGTFLTVVQAAANSRNQQYELRDLLSHLRQVNEQLEERTRLLQKLTLDLNQAEERIRRRVAYFLHDDLQQVLVGATYHLTIVSRQVGDDSKAQETLTSLDGLLRDAVEKSRNLAAALSPPILHNADLATALQWVVQQAHDNHGLEVVLTADPLAQVPDDDLKVMLFRAVQELLLNIAKHASCDQATVWLHDTEEQLVLEVSDDGVGFEEGELTGESGLGLCSLRERFEARGGRMLISSRHHGGTQVQVIIPRDRLQLASPPEDQSPEKTSE